MLSASGRRCRRRERGRGQLRRHRATCGRPPARGRMTGRPVPCIVGRDGPTPAIARYRPQLRPNSALACARAGRWRASLFPQLRPPSARRICRDDGGAPCCCPARTAGPCRFRGRSDTPPTRVPAPSGTAPLPAAVRRRAGGSRRRGRAPSGTAPLPAVVHALARPASPAGMVRQASQAPASVACGTASRMGSGRTAPCCRCAHFTPS